MHTITGTTGEFLALAALIAAHGSLATVLLAFGIDGMQSVWLARRQRAEARKRLIAE